MLRATARVVGLPFFLLTPKISLNQLQRELQLETEYRIAADTHAEGVILRTAAQNDPDPFSLHPLPQRRRVQDPFISLLHQALRLGLPAGFKNPARTLKALLASIISFFTLAVFPAFPPPPPLSLAAAGGEP